jgi:K+-transporting ATPase ATPase A chain
MQEIEFIYDIVQSLALLAILTLLAKPLGGHIANVYEGKKKLTLSLLFGPVERGLYSVAGIDRDSEMNWKEYAWAVILFSSVGIIVVFIILILQGYLPFNPEKFTAFPWYVALNTAVSFVTNTNWQAYSGESAASYFAQVIGLMVQHFLSAATGIAICIALIRGFARRSAETIGNFWVDLTRGILYILLPIAFVSSLILVSQGVIQNFSSYKTIRPLEGAGPRIRQSELFGETYIREQTLPMGPVASQEAIKELGTNGGGFFNANAAHPYENPTPFSNFFQILLILLIPAALTNTFGRMLNSPRQGWAIYAAMMLLFVFALGALYWAEYNGVPSVQKLGIHGPYTEGKEIRFGTGGSALYSAATTATSCGAVNNMHDSLTPLGGMVALTLILLGEVVFGGVGSGLYTMLAFVVIAVFAAGLMIGRTPDCFGKKIEVQEMWMSVITVLTAGIVVLVFTAISLVIPSGLHSLLNPGPHGLSEVLYAFASTANNNGSAFAGLNASTVYYCMMTSVAMLAGRFLPAIAILSMAGSLAGKKYVLPSAGTLPTDRLSFIFWLLAVIVIVGALTFFPALALGPIADYLNMRGGI